MESWRLRGGNPPQKYEIQDHSPAVISEREKKAVEHCLSQVYDLFRNLKAQFNLLCSLGDEQTCPTSQSYTLVYNSREPDLVFEFRYRSKAMLQALGIISPPKRETPPIIDVEDEDPIPPPKRQKAGHNEDIIRSMQVRGSWRVKPVLSPNDTFNWNRRNWSGCGAGWVRLKGGKLGLLVLRRNTTLRKLSTLLEVGIWCPSRTFRSLLAVPMGRSLRSSPRLHWRSAQSRLVKSIA